MTFGNPIYDVYIRKVVKRPDGKFWNVPIETYPRRLAILALRSGDLSEAARLFPHLPGNQEGLIHLAATRRGRKAAPAQWRKVDP